MISPYALNPMPIGTQVDIQNRDQRAEEINACKKIQWVARACLVAIGVLTVGCAGVIAVTNSMELNERSLDVRNAAINRILSGCLGAAFGSAMLFLVSTGFQIGLEIEQSNQRPFLNEQV